MAEHVDSRSIRCLLLSLLLALLKPGLVVAQELPLLAAAAASPGLADPTDTGRLPSEPTYTADAPGESSLAANPASMPPMAIAPAIVQPKAPDSHRFWDSENRALFAIVGAFAAADFCATRANLAKGGQELNPVTRVLSGSTPGLAANFALETGSVVAISYMFHRTGHHKLERIASLVNISTSATAVGYDLAHR